MRFAILILCCAVTGCSILPEIAHQPVIHNPFPQLSRVAIAPFNNLSTEPTVDGRRFAEAYFNELQQVPGFEVVPVGVVETAVNQLQLSVDSREDRLRLCQYLGVDALVIGAVTDFSPYYPPRCGLHVEWYAANPCFHPIPPGYGLPWGTPDEETIPAPLVFEAEFALAKAQLETQTPPFTPPPPKPPQMLSPEGAAPLEPVEQPEEGLQAVPIPSEAAAGLEEPAQLAGYESALESALPPSAGLPPDWPDAAGFIPPPPSAHRPPCQETNEPVLKHTQIFNGNDMEFTEALAGYYHFRDDARTGGWQTYLQRSDDFIRFCCHAHISEMLSARGGAGETRVVWRWPTGR